MAPGAPSSRGRDHRPKELLAMIDTSRLAGPVAGRIAEADWTALSKELNAYGNALTGRILTPAECREITALYDEPARFRTTVDMARHRFGSGQYRYFTHDLPEPVQQLREAFYPRLLPIARDWAAKLGKPAPGRTACTSGSGGAMRPGSPSPRRSCCVTAPATGTPCTATCSATWSSRSRSSSASTRPAPTSPAASS
jgi:hypothetical protein